MSPALAVKGTGKFGLMNALAVGDLQFITSASGSAASSISINGCFSAAYDHYLVMRNLLGSSVDQNINIRLRVASVDASGADYRYQFVAADAASVTGGRGTGNTSALYGLGTTETTSFGFSQTWISNPFAAVRTTLWTNMGYNQDGGPALYSWVGEHDLTTSYDGLTAIPSGGTLTGDIYVYGLAV